MERLSQVTRLGLPQLGLAHRWHDFIAYTHTHHPALSLPVQPTAPPPRGLAEWAVGNVTYLPAACAGLGK